MSYDGVLYGLPAEPPVAGSVVQVRERYEQGATILTSNTSFAQWGKLMNDEVLATALLDRLLHHAEVLTINGKSYRMKDRNQRKEARPEQ